jgi:hypothetical protein
VERIFGLQVSINLISLKEKLFLHRPKLLLSLPKALRKLGNSLRVIYRQIILIRYLIAKHCQALKKLLKICREVMPRPHQQLKRLNRLRKD